MQNDSFLLSSYFYLKYAWFQLKERFTDLGSSIAYILLYPFFIWLLTKMWGRFNAYQGNYTQNEVFIYISITELLFMTFLRSPFLQRSHADFSIILARPRSWLKLTFFGQLGATLGSRSIYALTATLVLHGLGAPTSQIGISFIRLLYFLPILGIIEALISSVLCSAQLLWHETRYLVLPISKIFLALGGVFGPLADYGEPGKTLFLKLPASDLFFQVGHYCLKGEFYQLSNIEWSIRIFFWILLFSFLNYFFYLMARKNHQSFGG